MNTTEIWISLQKLPQYNSLPEYNTKNHRNCYELEHEGTRTYIKQKQARIVATIHSHGTDQPSERYELVLSGCDELASVL